MWDLFADNRFEWILADCAVQLCGAVDVPRGRDVTDNELIYIINHAGIKVTFVENKRFSNELKAWSRICQTERDYPDGSRCRGS
jgi:long-chain acyl-CoA synthetase